MEGTKTDENSQTISNAFQLQNVFNKFMGHLGLQKKLD
jgi:hypothetical protein